MMDTGIILIALIFSLIGNIWLLSGQVKLRGLIRTGLRKAERDNCEMVRLPYNQTAKIMGWQPEFEEDVRISHYPMRSAKEFRSGHTKHPATLSPSKRGQL